MTSSELKQMFGDVAATLRQNEGIATPEFLAKCEEFVSWLKKLFNEAPTSSGMSAAEAASFLDTVEKIIRMERDFVAGPSSKVIETCDGLQNRPLLLKAIAAFL